MRGKRQNLVMVLAGVGSFVLAAATANAQELQCKTLRGTKAVAAVLAHRSIHELGSLPCGVDIPPADQCEIVDVEDIAESATTMAAACNANNYAAQCKLAAAAFRTTCRDECEHYFKTIATAQSCKGPPTGVSSCRFT